MPATVTLGAGGALQPLTKAGGQLMAQSSTGSRATSRVREITEGFGKGHDVAKYFADDAEYIVLPLGQLHQGKEQLKALFQVFYHDAFSPASAQVKIVVPDSDGGLGVLDIV